MEYRVPPSFIEEGYAGAKAAIPEIKALLREKDPTIEFVPQGGRDQGVDEDFRRRFEEALEAVRPAASRSWLRAGAAVTVKTARQETLPRFRWDAALGGPQHGAIATYNHRRPIGGGVTHTLGGVTQSGRRVRDECLSSFFVRKSPGDDGFSPGAGVKARWGSKHGPALGIGGRVDAHGKRR